MAVFAVVTLAFTLLAAGRARRSGGARAEIPALADDPTMQDHADAGDLLRFTVFALTFVLVGLLFAKPHALRIVLRVLLGAAGADRDLLHDPHRPPRREAGLGRGRGAA